MENKENKEKKIDLKNEENQLNEENVGNQENNENEVNVENQENNENEVNVENQENNENVVSEVGQEQQIAQEGVVEEESQIMKVEENTSNTESISKKNKYILGVVAAIILVVCAVAFGQTGGKDGQEQPVVSDGIEGDKGTEGNKESEEAPVVTEEEKEEVEIVKQVEEVLDSEKITDISVTDNSGDEPVIFVQLKLDGEKGSIENSLVESEVNSIVEKVESISKGCQMDIVDSNDELIALYLEGSIEFK